MWFASHTSETALPDVGVAYWGTAGDNRIFGGEGADTLYGGMGNDLLVGEHQVMVKREEMISYMVMTVMITS
ncbi:hypothetical protein INT80_11400 [Gallibacterium anatis]|uniref:Uncharacterized protein n=1 Tax=Gallibacterium anatis TaxID=750 RepID=A0A930Y8X4_9PAST|nr:hypothetical protein [Gallibacterium anatis]